MGGSSRRLQVHVRRIFSGTVFDIIWNFPLMLALSLNTSISLTFKILFMTEPREESKPRIDPRDHLDSSRARGELSHHRDDKDETTGNENRKGE